MLDETIEVLTEQMIKDHFANQGNKEEKFIISKQDLYEFCIKLVKVIEGVYRDEGKK